MQQTTLLYLIKRKGEKISDICLAMKKRSFGAGRWNGVGGKLDAGESLQAALLRETEEEINVIPKKFSKKAELTFSFPHKPEWNQIVNVYFCDEWEGKPQESEEMKPGWFAAGNLPFDEMWPSDRFWLQAVIGGKLLKADFSLGENDEVLEHGIELVENI